MFSKNFLTLLSVLWLTIGVFAEDEKPEAKPKSEYKKSLTKDCATTYSATCLKLDVVSWVEKLNEQNEFSVFPGISVIKEEHGGQTSTAEMVAELARDFPNDPDARLNGFLMKKIASYINSHSLRLNLLNRDTVETARGKGGGGGGDNQGGGGSKGGGGGGGMQMVMAAGAMMKGTLLALALGGIAAIAGKALTAGLISLLISAIIGFKQIGPDRSATTYEIVSKPIYTHSSSHSVGHEEHHPSYGHSSYGRSFDASLPLGLQPEYKPA